MFFLMWLFGKSNIMEYYMFVFRVALVSILFGNFIYCEEYCKAPLYHFSNGQCERCPVCKHGFMNDKMIKLRIDPELGAMNCFPCVPCKNGTFSNEDTFNSVKQYRSCMNTLRCDLLNREYKVEPSSTNMGECSHECLIGYYPMDDLLHDSECYSCTQSMNHRKQCKDWSPKQLVDDSPTEEIGLSTPWIVIITLAIIIIVIVFGIGGMMLVKFIRKKYPNLYEHTPPASDDTLDSTIKFVTKTETGGSMGNADLETISLYSPTDDIFNLIHNSSNGSKEKFEISKGHIVPENSVVFRIVANRANVDTVCFFEVLFPDRADITQDPEYTFDTPEGRFRCLQKWREMQEAPTYYDVCCMVNSIYSMCNNRTIYSQIFYAVMEHGYRECQHEGAEHV